MQKKHKKLLMLLTFILVVTSTIAYSALTSTLQIDAEAKLRIVSDIRVTGISLSSSSGATLQYESSYDVNTITSGFILPTTESSITYKVTVANNGTIDQTIYDILTQSSNNSGLYYTISGYNVKDVIGFKSVIEFYITYKTTTPSNDPINVVNRFNFKEVYHITFETKGGSNIPEAIKYEGVDLDLSTFTSTKQGYILSGWTDEQDGTTVKYQTDGTYTLDRDLILYAVWTSDPNTNYTVNHYVHDLGTDTYTLNSTDNLTGETDSTVTLANLKKTIPGFTYVDGYLTGGTTKPTEGAVTTTTILADGSRVINLYYRRNYLWVQYHVNGGQLAEQHGSSVTVINDLIASNNKTTFLRGVYGSKVGGVNTSTYETSNGLHNYNSPGAINIEKNGYIGKSKQEWNTSSDGTGTSYNHDVVTYNANGFAGADLSTGDQVVTLYVNWVPVDYEIMYDLQGGVLYNITNPATYNIETNTITLNNPTKIGYTFLGWTGSNGNTPQTTVTIPKGSTGDKAYIANWQVNNYTVIADANDGNIPATTGWTGTGATSTKQVTYDNLYGTLPTPTRNGYIFKGWNGKNLFNKDATDANTGTYIKGDGTIISYEGYTLYQISIKPNTTYTITNSGRSIAPGYVIFNESGTRVAGESYASRATITFTTPSTASYIKLSVVTDKTGTDSYRYDKDSFQLEESSSATTYEPYYVTSSVNVTQSKDHVLTAVWEPINYEIMYDLQGGVLYNTTNPTTYNPDTNTITLNNPTKIGYTFLGWTGSNGNTPETTVTIPIGSTGDKAYIANWQVNNYILTFDANGGNVSTTTKSVQYGQTYNDLPTPTREGYTFRGWYKTFDGTNDYINMGREYMYEDKISVHTSAYMDDWSTFTSVIFSSLQTGGWGILPVSDNFRFSCYDSGVGYKYVNTSTALASLSSGWHDFDLVFDGEYAYGYVDGKLSGKSAKFTSGNIGYNPTNSIFIGGEATNSPTEPNTHRFTGNLGNIIIKNNDKLISRTTYNTITAPAQDLTLYAKWDSNATFLPGSEFNAKIKQLAGDIDATHTTRDANITTIVRYPGIPTSTMLSNAEIVSTTDSTTPIYAWFDNGVIYYYTESEYPYMNSDASSMFYALKNVTAIDVSTINTSRTVNMRNLFDICNNLEIIDLSNFDTSSVTNMAWMFASNYKLQTINLSNFNTSNVTNMDGMFGYMSALLQLDLSNFDMSSVTTINNFFYNTPKLESLKTPKVYPTDTSVNITLPSTLYTQDGTGYSAIDSTSPTETWLYKMICKRATTLHTEQCSQTSKTLYCSASGYQVGGSKNTTTITYGNFGTDNTSLNGGDAFTCDVNGDGIYNEETERFYYVSDYYNTQTKSFETDTGVLVYYNNVSAGVPNNTDIFTYDDTDNLHGPRSATQQLPTTNQWSNVSLKNTERAILNYQNGNTADSEQLPSNYSYLGHSARLLTQQEINSSIGKAITSFGNQTKGLDLLAPHYFENTRYSNNNLNASWWLEGTTVGATTHALRIMTTTSTQYGNGIYTLGVLTSIGVRPAIEVNKNFLNKKVYSYLITYDTNGGSENTTQTISVGNSLSTLPTNPTRRGYSFDGWYTAKTGGTQITTSTVPTTNTTYYAHWSPNTYTLTFNANGGNVSTTTKSVEYGTTYNDLPTPTRAGYTFKGWYQIYNHANHDYTSYGRDYMYKDKISIHASAYMEDWSNAKTLLSSTEAGGWSINNNNGNITFYIYDGNVGYKTKESSVSWASLSPGWHDFDLVFDGEYAYGYLDGTKITTSDKFTSGSIGYHGFNQILIGSETWADGSPTLAQCFDGNIGNVVIKNDDTLISGTTYNTITAPAQNATLYAKWEPINYEITYDLQGGTLSTDNPATYNAETETFTLNNPTKTGYMFVGWTGSNGLIPETTVTIPKGSYKDRAYIANWNEIYTITLNPNGGSVNPTTIDILEGNSLGILPTPTKTDFEFIGWYTDVSGTLVDSSTVPTVSTTLIAHYEPSITKGAIYSANGGKFNSDKSVNVVEYDEDSETPLQTITKYSHTSNIDDTGLKSSDYGGNWNNTNIRGTDRTTSSSEAHVITIPGASELTVDLYYNGESVSYDWVSVWAGSYPSYTAFDNRTSTGYVTTAMGAPNNNNKFGGSQSGSYTVNENSLTNMGYTRLTIPGDSVTFSFRSDGGGYGQGYGYYAIVSGTARVNTENYKTPTRTGYTFNNWNTTSDASGTRYIDEQDIIDYVNNNNTALRLYAEWIPKTYTITLNPNGATNTPTSSLTATYDSSALSPSSITVPEKVYTTTINTTLDPNRNSDGATITGDTTPKSRIYTFDGWRTSSSGGTMVINNSVTPTLIPSTSGYTDANGNWVKDENITLYAKWIDPGVTTVTLPKITKAGFKCGWTNVSTLDKIATINNTKLDSEATFNPGDNNYTLYPVCELDKYFELTYDANDGYFGYPVTTSPTTTNKVIYTKDGNTTTAFADGVRYREYKKPIRDGYRFDGWSTSKTATTPTYADENAAKAIVEETGSATLYAVWTRVWAENLSYDNTNTLVNCSDAQCMLDYLATRLTNKGTTKFKVGDYIQMTPQNSTYTTIPKYTGYDVTATINPKELNLWRVIRVNSNGTYDAVSEYASSVSPYFQGTLGYQNFVGYLNKIASQYENPRYTVGSRYMGYNGQTEFITDTSYFDGTSTKAASEWTISTSGTPAEEYLGRGDSLYQTDYDLVKTAYGGSSDSVKANRVGTTTSIPYWIGSRYYLMNSVSAFGFLSRNVFASGGININDMFRYSDGSWNPGASGYALRPIIILRSGLTATGTGTKNDPYMLN